MGTKEENQMSDRKLPTNKEIDWGKYLAFIMLMFQMFKEKIVIREK